MYSLNSIDNFISLKMRFKRGSLYGYLYGFTIPNPTIFDFLYFDSDFLSFRHFFVF